MLYALKLYSEAVERLRPVTPFPEKESLSLLTCALDLPDSTPVMLDLRNLTIEYSVASRFEELVKRRECFEPMAYILGNEKFYGRVFEVNQNVLIPRPETEFLLDIILNQYDLPETGYCLDVGTGSGVIAITMKLERPELEVFGTDISYAALKIAARNSILLKASVTLLQADLMNVFQKNSIDILISNPPYISDSQKVSLQRDIIDYEPHQALFSDHSGLSHLFQILEQCPKILKPGGSAFLEIGEDQLPMLENECKKYRYSDWEFIKDFHNKNRFLRILI